MLKKAKPASLSFAWFWFFMVNVVLFWWLKAGGGLPCRLLLF